MLFEEFIAELLTILEVKEAFDSIVASAIESTIEAETRINAQKIW